jgi:iron complex transport system substrate-binding protein
MKKGMMKWIIISVIIIALAAAIGVSLIQLPKITPEKYGLSITDDFGRNVIIEGKQERIVSLSPTETEILFALDLGDKVVGVTTFCDYPSEAVNKEKVGDITTVSVEKVIKLNPDLVLAVNLNGEETVDKLDDYFPVFAIDDRKINKIEDIFSLIEVMGKITGEEEKANALVARMRGRVEEIENKTKGEEKVKVAHITWHEPIWVTGRGNYQDDILEKAGGENVFGDIEDWGTVSLEELIKRNPDAIIVSVGHGAAEGKPYEFIMTDKRLAEMKARKKGRIYPIDADITGRSGPRVVEALEEIAQDLHPELF